MIGHFNYITMYVIIIIYILSIQKIVLYINIFIYISEIFLIQTHEYKNTRKR